ncbi:MAG: tryptophan-rich sensory protein [Lachnospiraceae bacterium]|nr:tryptophan-rich sensory protein [Lachnospiraceae bacterium]
MKKKWKSLIVCIAIPLAVGAGAAFFTKENMAVFDTVQKPPLSPPGWLFPVVWTILYILMGIASWLIYKEAYRRPYAADALIPYGIQLFFNFFWPIIFFNFSRYQLAFIWLLILLFFIVRCIQSFDEWNSTASALLVPYMIWVIFAGYLNLGIAVLN